MKKRILIVENDPGVRDVEKRFLEMQGFDVLEADNAKDGVELAITNTPDMIIMDIRLPCKKKGIGAALLIRNNEKTRNTPILFVTGYAKGQDSTEINNIPNCEYLTKPIDFQEFLYTTKKLTGLLNT